MRLKEKVESLCRKYDTRDPFEIADQKSIIVLHEELGTIKGYYNRLYRQQFIHINQNLDEIEADYVCAHELAHSILHPDLNTAFLREKTFFSIDRLEAEAKKFAILLRFTDDDVEEMKYYTVSQIAMFWGIDEDAVRYRISAFGQ